VRILFGSDGSRYSLAAARFLGAWIPGKGKEVDLVAVSPPSSRRSYRKPQPVDELWKGELGRWLADTARPLESTGYEVEPLAVSSVSAASYLVDRSRTKEYDLVVVGGRGRSEAPFFDVGSVARSVLEFAPTSVLMVREREPGEREKRVPDALHPFRILLPTDGEDHSLEAIRRLLTLLDVPNVTIRVVTTLANGELEALGSLSPVRREGFRQEAHKRARLRLNHAENFFKPHDLPVESEILEGTAEEAVPADARSWDADLLVMGSRGSMDEVGSRRQRSTALAMARSAPTSVLLVRHR
jgi:nucleotide-binding universal stress UspA family protein